MEQVDGKIQTILEKLKKENQTLWSDTVRQAEMVFSNKGISDVLDLMPDSL